AAGLLPPVLLLLPPQATSQAAAEPDATRALPRKNRRRLVCRPAIAREKDSLIALLLCRPFRPASFRAVRRRLRDSSSRVSRWGSRSAWAHIHRPFSSSINGCRAGADRAGHAARRPAG